MFEKVNPSHPDKVADRIGGAIVDLGYKMKERPSIAGECMVGHNDCKIMIETNVGYNCKDIIDIVKRITKNKNIECSVHLVPQDEHLAANQEKQIRCGDNGIFKSVVPNSEERRLVDIVQTLYKLYPYDGKFIYDEQGETLIACQSHVKTQTLEHILNMTNITNISINPIGDWTGGINVDTGCCNRKLGSDMGRAVTGGGLHFKDASKADVAINIYLHLLTDTYHENFIAKCAIGDTYVIIKKENGTPFATLPYEDIVNEVLEQIMNFGGFEKFAEWGLLCNQDLIGD